MNFLNDSIIHALCRTFAHSLWQGLLLAVLTGVAIQLTRKKSAAQRYNLLSLLLAGFLVTVSVTFVRELDKHEELIVNGAGSGSPVTKAVFDYTTGTTASPVAENLTILEKVQSETNRFLHRYAGLIVGLWFLVFCYKLFVTVNGLKTVYRLRNYRVSEPSDYWKERVSHLAALVRTPLAVKVLESRLVDVPAVAGFFKPVILLPFGMLGNIPPEQVEAILLHELAHIRRADYLVNLLQRFVETLFFFNPAVLWLSATIKDERENCCDDIAVGITGSKREFVEALVSFQEYSNDGDLALGLSGRKSSLLNRSKRLLYSDNSALNLIEKSAVSICLLLLIAVSFAFTKPGPAQQKAVQQEVAGRDTSKLNLAGHYDPDKIPEGTCMRVNEMVNGQSQPTWLFKSQDTLYQISADLQLFRINGKLIPQDDYKIYLPKIRELMAAFRKQETTLTNFLGDTRDRLLEDNAKPKTPVTTTHSVTTTFSTTTVVEDGVVISHTSDSSVVRN